MTLLAPLIEIEGATLLTDTPTDGSFETAVPSVTFRATEGVARPSGNKQSNVPLATVGEPCSVPPVPHFG